MLVNVFLQSMHALLERERACMAWLEAQISTLKAAGRWIGDEPNPRDKQQRLEKDGRGAFIVCFIPRTPW